MTLKPHWQQPWEKRHRTVRVVCVSCMTRSHITLYGLPNEYRGLVKEQKCPKCGQAGTLNTSELAKARPIRDTTNQLQLFGDKKR